MSRCENPFSPGLAAPSVNPLEEGPVRFSIKILALEWRRKWVAFTFRSGHLELFREFFAGQLSLLTPFAPHTLKDRRQDSVPITNEDQLNLEKGSLLISFILLTRKNVKF